jgi:branched-chain amino acid transport system substrate-binding protein
VFDNQQIALGRRGAPPASDRTILAAIARGSAMTSKITMLYDSTTPHAGTALHDKEPARRRVLRAVAIAGVAALLLGAPTLAARAADPIKIGVLLPLSGNFAVLGQQALAGMKIYLDQVGNKAGDHPIDLLVEDSQGKPDVAVTKARKLVQCDGAQVLTGVVSSGEALAVNDYSRDNKVPLVLSGDAGVSELTMPGPLANPYLVRTSQNGRSVGAVGADWAYKKGWRKVVTVGSDYAGGLDVDYAFAQQFCSLGGRVIQAEWTPLGTADFGPYLTNLDRTADAVVAFAPGADGLRLARQFSDFGLKGKLPVLDLFGTLVYETNLPQLGDAALGMYSVLFYTPMLTMPENQSFVAEFQKRMHFMPANEAPNGYVGAEAIVDALKAVNGDLSDKMKFIAALKVVKFDSPKGPISLDQYGQVIQSMYIREVQKVDGQPANVPIVTYKNVDQFWPYTEAEYASFKYTYKDAKNAMTDCTRLLAKK